MFHVFIIFFEYLFVRVLWFGLFLNADSRGCFAVADERGLNQRKSAFAECDPWHPRSNNHPPVRQDIGMARIML